MGLRGLRLLDTLRGALRGLGDEEDDALPRLAGGPRPLLGEGDREGERAGLLIGERLRLRPTGDLLGGLRGRLGERRLGGGGDLRRTGLPRILLGDDLGGDRKRRGGEEGERPLTGDGGLLLGPGESPRRNGESALRRGGGGESCSRLGDPLRGTGDLLRGGESCFRRGETSLRRFPPSLSPSAAASSAFGASLLDVVATALGGEFTFFLSGNVNLARTTLPSI